MAHLEKLKVDKAKQKGILSSLESNGPIPARDPIVLFTVPGETVPDEEKPLEDAFDAPHEDQLRTDKRRNKCDLRTERLGSIQEKLVVYSANSWTRVLPILHRNTHSHTSSSWLVSHSPGLDFPNYRFMGTEMPTCVECDKMCHLCSRKDVKAGSENSSGTCTSSSTDAEGPDEPAR